MEETDDAWVVEAELPGVNRQEINLEVRDGELVISGELKERDRNVKSDRIEASLDKGVLTVRVPKFPRSQPKRIEVKAPS